MGICKCMKSSNPKQRRIEIQNLQWSRYANKPNNNKYDSMKDLLTGIKPPMQFNERNSIPSFIAQMDLKNSGQIPRELADILILHESAFCESKTDMIKDVLQLAKQ